MSRDIKNISCELLLSSKSEDKPPLIRNLQDLLRVNNLHTTVHCCLTFFALTFQKSHGWSTVKLKKLKKKIINVFSRNFKRLAFLFLDA